MKEIGLVHVYTGDGKGKTTAAFGLALRAYENGLRVYIVQFLKTSPSGEAAFVERLGDERLRVFRFEKPHGFTYDPDAETTKALRVDVKRALDFIQTVYQEHSCDLLVLDEIICACQLGLVTREELCALVDKKPAACELVLTGRGAPDWLIERADYVTNMTLVKHPFQTGTEARKGIEF